MCPLCSIRHDFPITMHTPGACGQWSVSDHNGGRSSGVHGTRYGPWWPWYGQFEVGWLQPPLSLGACISWVAPVLVLRDKDLGHVQPHPIWLEPTAGCRNWKVASNLHSGHLPDGRYRGPVSLLLAGQLFCFPQFHNWLVSSRNEHVCLCHSITRGDSRYGKLKGSPCLHPQSPASRTASQCRLLHHGELGPCAGNSPVPVWWR